MYTIVRNAPPPTFEQLGREIGDCAFCKSDQESQTSILPEGMEEGMEKLAELGVGDALDGPWAKRNKIGIAVKGYDRINRTKHEYYKLDSDTVRVWRLK